MKVLLLADINSIHTIKWIKALHQNGIELAIFSLSTKNHNEFENIKDLKIHSLNLSNNVSKSGEGNSKKLSYFFALPKIKKLIQEFKPDILHAHYASSYGLLGALCNFKPYIVSVWGSDIFDFPNRNFLFKNLIKFTLNQATKVLSTSEVMALETKKYCKKEIVVTPFGVDTQVFKKDSLYKKNEKKVIGTIKALEYKYGIDLLIQVFAELVSLEKNSNLQLEIYGDGSQKDNLIALSEQLGIRNKVNFKGKINHQEVPLALQEFDIYVALSRWDSESFGVAIIEAQACEIPVVVSNKGGLPEVVKNQETGIVVDLKETNKIANIIQTLLDNKTRREEMGNKGRIRVQELYEWEKNVALMENIYKEIMT